MAEAAVEQHQSNGIVHLVGAGPGDPGLLTVRGMKLLDLADVVVYDALVNPKLLNYCPHAEQVYVGKKAAAHSMSQEQINALLIERAKRGRRVVRLKGGDPFVFGRGGEECEALSAAKVRFEVVPGITAAIAAPAYAGIPVTHRDFNSSFTLITGHEKEREYREEGSRGRDAGAASDLDWPAIARLPCVAFYMGVKSLPRICAKLIEHGMSRNTPAATIQHGTTPRQRTIVATLADLAEKVAAAKLSPPALTIVGRVVELRRTINWFESRPLFGQTIVVTRTRQQASELSSRLEEMGAEVIEAPTIALAPPPDWAQVDSVFYSLSPSAGRGPGKGEATPPNDTPLSPALSPRRGEGVAPPDWIVFTSVNGVSFTRQRLLEIGLDVRVFGAAKIAAIGNATAQAIRDQLCLRVDLCPDRFVAEALADELVQRGEVRGRRFLLLRADIARPLLRERLERAGAAQVSDVAIYQTLPAEQLPRELLDALSSQRIDWITFTSSSTARNFAEMLGPDFRSKLAGVGRASIGPITSQTLRELGLSPTVEAQRSDIEGLVAAMTRRPS